jgi:hypothetical protein
MLSRLAIVGYHVDPPIFLTQFCMCSVPIETTFTNATDIVLGGILADDIVGIDIDIDVVGVLLCLYRRRWEILVIPQIHIICALNEGVQVDKSNFLGWL